MPSRAILLNLGPAAAPRTIGSHCIARTEDRKPPRPHLLPVTISRDVSGSALGTLARIFSHTSLLYVSYNVKLQSLRSESRRGHIYRHTLPLGIRD